MSPEPPTPVYSSITIEPVETSLDEPVEPPDDRSDIFGSDADDITYLGARDRGADTSNGGATARTVNAVRTVRPRRVRSVSARRIHQSPPRQRSSSAIITPEIEPIEPQPEKPSLVVQPAEAVLDHVYFKYNEVGIDGYQSVLNAFAELAADSSARLVLIAHADSGETDPQGVSDRRAATVKSYLISRGVPASRLRVRVLGASKPLSLSPTNDDMSAHNRCVQLAIEKPSVSE